MRGAFLIQKLEAKMKKKQTKAERNLDVMGRELDRVTDTMARQKRTGKKGSIPWIFVNLDTGEIEPPPNVPRVVFSKPKGDAS
jgi:hypothetical protein